MQNTRKITTILTLAVAFCFLLVSLAQAGPNDPITEQWAKKNLKNRKKTTSIPIWQITEDGTNKSVTWQDRAQNPRFAIYDVLGNNAGGSDILLDDLVLDKETGLFWARDANLADGIRTWQSAMTYCNTVTLGNRKGWRLPTKEELSSLVDPSQSNPALPTGHPFINVVSGVEDYYWSSTTYEMGGVDAWAVSMFSGFVGHGHKASDGYLHYVWPVRGGNGYATGNWSPTP